MIIIVIIAVLGFIIYLGSEQSRTFTETNKFNISDLISSGKYVSGHPNLDESIENTNLFLDINEVKIFKGFALKTTIPKNVINNVIIEDASTIQNRVTVGRLLLTGVFAFAWKKKTKQECAYLIIEWKQGNFNNETIFEFEGKGSISNANTLRNKFINYLSNNEVVNTSEKLEQKIHNEIKIENTEEQIYIDLISKNRDVEAINAFIYKNKCSVKVAKEYIEKLKDETNL